MTTGFEASTLGELAITARRIKKSIQAGIEADRDFMLQGGPRGCAPHDIWWIQVYLLTNIEKEIRMRGANPAHPTFGPDIMATISKMMAELVASGERSL